MKRIKSPYATYSAGDAFIAAHLGEWTNDHKSEMTKSQLAHLVFIMEHFAHDIYESKQDPDKIANHLNMIFEDINKER